jgi:hypothetical protein
MGFRNKIKVHSMANNIAIGKGGPIGPSANPYPVPIEATNAPMAKQPMSAPRSMAQEQRFEDLSQDLY